MTATPTHIPAPLQARATNPSEHARQVSRWLGMPELEVSIAVGGEGVPNPDDRAFTLTVVNLAGQACKGLFLLDVIVGTAADGGPDGVQTATWTKGTARSVVANQQFEVVTDDDGTAAVAINVAGAGTRHVRALVRGVLQGSGEIAWA